jgi:biofilm PGA synthesis lipoprotein PgaB
VSSSSPLDADGRPSSWRLRCAHLGIRGLLTVAAITLIAVPMVFALRLHESGLEVGPRYESQPASVSTFAAARWRSMGATLPAHAAPVVIAYHDIRPGRAGGAGEPRPGRATGRYTVTPSHFDQQLTMLQTAGYRSLSSGQYIAYLRGGPVPPRSVFITFDCATQGLWTFADPILARHHMHGVSFLDPRLIGVHWTRYLSWAEIQRMAAGGRWDFGAAVSRRTLNPLAGSIRTQMAAGLRRSADALAVHHLPVPRLLTWPKPSPGALWRQSVPADAAQVVRAPFVVAFSSDEEFVPVTSRRAARGKLLGRIDVRRSTSADTLLETVAALTAIPVARARPLSHPSGWSTALHDASPVTVTGETLNFTGAGRYESVSYAPDATADWENYVVQATVQDLPRTSGGGASIRVRVGSTRELIVRVGVRSAAVIESHGVTTTTLRRSRLFPSLTHDVRIVVGTSLTMVTIDRLVTLAVRVPDGRSATGGIGLASFRQNPRRSWPAFSRVTVTPATAAAVRPQHLTPLSLRARSPLARSSLWVRSRFALAAVLTDGHSLRFTGARIRESAAYAPARTSRWRGYAFSATVENLLAGESVGLYGRLGSRSQAEAIVSRHWIEILAGRLGSRRLMVSRGLPSGASHRVSMRVLGRATVVQVDGMNLGSVPAGPGDTGGIGVGAKRGPGQTWPRLTGMMLVPIR